jgi:hypothetical protein
VCQRLAVSNQICLSGNRNTPPLHCYVVPTPPQMEVAFVAYLARRSQAGSTALCCARWLASATLGGRFLHATLQRCLHTGGGGVRDGAQAALLLVLWAAVSFEGEGFGGGSATTAGCATSSPGHSPANAEPQRALEESSDTIVSAGIKLLVPAADAWLLRCLRGQQPVAQPLAAHEARKAHNVLCHAMARMVACISIAALLGPLPAAPVRETTVGPSL